MGTLSQPGILGAKDYASMGIEAAAIASPVTLSDPAPSKSSRLFGTALENRREASFNPREFGFSIQELLRGCRQRLETCAAKVYDDGSLLRVDAP